ncbi:hypothetical protein GEMRC1_005419 [Eukaryota sp. GEM-RC1]
MDLKYIPLVGIITTLTGVVICLAFAPFYYDDMPDRIFFISEAGGRYPFLPLFSFSLVLGGLIIAVASYLYSHIYALRSHVLSKTVIKLLTLVKLLAVVGGISLSLVGLISLYDNEPVHAAATQVFFISSMTNVILITYLSRQQFRTTDANGSNVNETVVKRWIKFRISICLILPFFVVPYLLLSPSIGYSGSLSVRVVFQYLSVTTLVSFFTSFRLEFDSVCISLNNVLKGFEHVLGSETSSV